MRVESSISTHDNLQRGIRIADSAGQPITYRYIQPADNIDLITAMLHEAYTPLAEQGLRFLATHQDSATTRRRMSRGGTLLALDADQIVGTITLKDVEHTSGSPCYDRPDVAGFAIELIAIYEAKGFRFVEYVQWPDLNYPSRIFAKALELLE